MRDWSHNDHFHGWLLRNLPARRRTALDIGCGRGGLLAKLADHVDHVTGIDPDAEMVAGSRASVPGAEIRQQSLLDTTGEYDVVTAVASLHHLPLEPALAHARQLVAPGGRLLVVGLADIGSPVDAAYGGVSVLLNPLVGLVKRPGPVSGPVPVRDPEESYGEVRAVAERVLRGARFRRRLFFRYTLRWDG